jgi:hypothetical protein
MEDWAGLLKAIAALLWPIFAFTALFVFKPELRAVLARLKKGKLLGQEIELEDSLNRLDRSASAAVAEASAGAAPQLPPPPGEVARLEEVTDRVLSEATQSPKAALLLLASEIERGVRLILESSGWAPPGRPIPIGQAFAILAQRAQLPNSLLVALRDFSDVRNRAVHGHEASDDDVIRAIDSGLRILQALQTLPHAIHTVYHPGAPLYEDPDGRVERQGLRALVLDNEAKPGRGRVTRSVHPTSRTDYKKGQRVSWEWNMSRVISESWYRDPDAGDIKYAWTSSAEFSGRPIG